MNTDQYMSKCSSELRLKRFNPLVYVVSFLVRGLHVNNGPSI